jgi:hypothetical protein
MVGEDGEDDEDEDEDDGLDGDAKEGFGFELVLKWFARWRIVRRPKSYVKSLIISRLRNSRFGIEAAV